MVIHNVKMSPSACDTFIVGCGYLGRRVAGRLLSPRHHVAGTTRSPAKAEQLRRLGIVPIVADVTQPETLSGLPHATRIVYAVGFDSSAPYARSRLHGQGLRDFLAAVPIPPQKFLFVSSTSVYGDCQGALVDEDSPCHPQTESGQVLLQAERELLAGPLADRVVILRLAGLYGPGRIPRVIDSREGADERCINLIHVEDAATAVCLALDQEKPTGCYTVSDNHPVSRLELRHLVLQYFGNPPGLRDTRISNAARHRPRGLGDKRICSDRIRHNLGFRCAYPTCASGLAAIARSSSGAVVDPRGGT